MSKHATHPSADIGMMGVGVMGSNLALNMADHGFRVALWDRDPAVLDRFSTAHSDAPGGLVPSADPRAFVASLKRPRKIAMLIKAGEATDWTIAQVADFLEEGDILIDGGNAFWPDTLRRQETFTKRGVRFLGSGVSGGEVGARFGPSLMVGGDKDAWREIEPIWKAIAAKVDPATGREITGMTPGKPTTGGEPCAAYIGPGAAGHFVKMVHNGIEYADMQTICEAYDLLRQVGGMSPEECARVFEDWNRGDLESFLVEITADILRQTDPRTGAPLVDVVLDAAGQKGTGKWTAIGALDIGAVTPTIAEAVFARNISARKEERDRASKILTAPPLASPAPDRASLVADLHDALLCAKICAYAQGFDLIMTSAAEQHWSADLASLAKVWRGGCIIRARLLGDIAQAFAEQREPENLLLAPSIAARVLRAQAGWRRTVALAATAGIPAPTMAASLAWFDALRAPRLPASLLQAQRDFFGAHTFERIDEPRGSFFHIDWTASPRTQTPR